MGKKTTEQVRDRLNRCMPAAHDAKLGDLLAELIAGHNALLADVTALRTRLNSSMISAAGLAVKAAGSPTIKAATAFAALANGVPVHKPADTDMAALVGTLATAKSAAWAFYIDGAGALTVSAKTADVASHAAAVAALPAPPDNKVMIGFMVVDNATGADFVGGTTPLDTAGLTVTCYNCLGSAAFAATLTAVEAADLGDR